MRQKSKQEERRLAYKKYPAHIDPDRGFCTPHQLCLRTGEAGIFFGNTDKSNQKHYIGMHQGSDGNILVIGGNGSGKSTGIIKPTLETWQGSICATDIKGELSEHYKGTLKKGVARRPCIIFDPTQSDGATYDPFWWVSQDDEANLYTNIMDVVCTIIPEIPNDTQPFWRKAEQAALAAGLIYCHTLGLGFIDSLYYLLGVGLSGLCCDARRDNCDLANIILGQLSEMKDESIANIDRGLRNNLIPFVADSYISHAFCGGHDGTKCFNWGDLEQSNIFLRIPSDKISQWGSAINLMYAQLIRYLERRPEQYSEEGQNNIQTLLMLDEFPRLGKLEIIVDAIPTLRSKNVNICLAVQSIAQLDRLYGEYGRRIIVDNCQYQAILRANDAETQEYLCHLIGSTKVLQESVSRNIDASGKKTGYSKQRAESLELRIFPHELSTLTDILLLSPYGVSKVKKFQPYSNGENPTSNK